MEAKEIKEKKFYSDPALTWDFLIQYDDKDIDDNVIQKLADELKVEFSYAEELAKKFINDDLIRA